jgi:hypothetical protein
MHLTRRFSAIVSGLAVVALLALAAPSNATSLSQPTHDSAGNKLVTTVFWNLNSKNCAQADHMTYKYTRNDGQFTASWNSGKIHELAEGCGSAENITKNVSGPSTALLTPGTVYSRGFGTMPWTTIGGYFGLTGYAKIDLHRSTQPPGTVSGRLCAQAGTSGGYTGSNCGNF